ncbi:CAP domain-containing protein [Deinococcus wulumuqiensis]|uniref:SCP domain-containing protein n=1 Tax=Deinococcus wulumuqiensis TaxID=980427 RepID=A0AAV4K707_9DEIO|nr:CAP domain-containing protein [Deinococcus wulumuqiensis]QII22479.1 CAP domain-containing protein [Deinococcus wulumuqiensis R12]GGI88207.1 hypothetical protein GCM10010914_23250 [Deinococcus wulumuqiensis]GGP30332.1 hypothetical protein GCM10008021_19830 [Deinococcus wulumuqiensis]
MKYAFPLLTLTLLLTGCTDITTPNPNPGDGGGVVTPIGSFTLSVPASLSVPLGQAVTLTPQVSLSNYSGSVSLDASAPGLNLTRNGDSFLLTPTATGSYAVTVTARGSDGQTQTAVTVVTVTSAEQPQPQPQPQPKPVFLPGAGAPVGSGDGTKEGTVYVSPSAQEVEVLNLVNEVRTKGTLNGTPATAGTCVDGGFSPRPALTYNGLFAFAARKHAAYMSNVGYEGHSESQTGSPFFYGATPRDRVVRAYRELAGLDKNYVGENDTYAGGELAGVGTNSPTAFAMVNWWMHSSAHCTALMDSTIRQFGAGHQKGVLSTNQDLWTLVVGK